MKYKFLSLLLALVATCSFAACDMFGGGANSSESNSTKPAVEKVDYASQAKLDFSSKSKKIILAPDEKAGKILFTHIDGDTTHFNVDRSINEDGKIKARYLGVDTPESTGDIEEWGKAASKFTKKRLESATSIVLESDPDDKFSVDSNDRYLCWVWYKPEGDTEYHLLNLELLQEGLAAESRTSDSRYDDLCSKAAFQSQTLGLYIYSTDKDPDFYYGEAIQTSLKEVRTNLDEYVGKRVAVNGIVSAYAGKGSIYVQEYDEGDNRTYGLPVFYGYSNVFFDTILTPGNEVLIVGEVTNSETFGYQISDLFYDPMDPNSKESIKCFSKNNTIVFPEITVDEFVANNYAYAKDLLYGTVSVNNLTVTKISTTADGNSEGAMTLTCQDGDGTEIKIRTSVLRNSDGSIITADKYKDKTISVKGIAEEYTYTDYTTNLPVTEYQINVFSSIHITIHE